MNQKPKPNLILHCGGAHVTMKEINAVQTPSPTQSWHPIPHRELITQVQNTLQTTNLKLGAVSHSLSHSGLRYFGLMEVKTRKESSDDYCWVLGLRNSHDKTFPCGIVAGAQVFVCDNLVRRAA
jgi:hypothetical protein